MLNVFDIDTNKEALADTKARYQSSDMFISKYDPTGLGILNEILCEDGYSAIQLLSKQLDMLDRKFVAEAEKTPRDQAAMQKIRQEAW